MISFDPDSIDWKKAGSFIPVIIQDGISLRILTSGYMNREDLSSTVAMQIPVLRYHSNLGSLPCESVHLHDLQLKKIKIHIDRNQILLTAISSNPTWQTVWGPASEPSLSILADLAHTIRTRRVAADESHSYTARLFSAGIARIAQKVGEEALESDSIIRRAS